MKLIIAGSRHLIDPGIVKNILYDLSFGRLDLADVSTVVCGDARGIDTSGRLWAEEEIYYPHLDYLKPRLPVLLCRPDWTRRGKAAGPLRNRVMAEAGDVLLLIWDGHSRGSASMKAEMSKLNKPIIEIITEITSA